jgi:hypothetical protein
MRDTFEEVKEKKEEEEGCSRLKVYTWNSFERKSNYEDIAFNLLPVIQLTVSKYDFKQDDVYEYYPKSRHYFLVFGWLFWGISFDLWIKE